MHKTPAKFSWSLS